MAMGSQDNKKKSRKWKNRHFIQALGHAWDGLTTAYREERNFRFHCAAALVVLICSFWLKVTWQEGIWLLFAIFTVVISEVLNSTIENLVDLTTNYQYHPLAKKAKDMAAGIVLLTAIFAAIVGLVILGPKLWNMFF